MFATVMTIFLALAAALAIFFQIRQIARGGIRGVSPLTWSLNAAVNIGWAVHIGMRGLWVVVVIDFVFAVLAFVVLSKTKPSRRDLVVGLAAATLMVGAQFTTPFIGSAAVALGTISMFLPQAWLVVRRVIAHDDVSGVSAVTWVINIGISLLWFLWGWAVGNGAMLAANGPVIIWSGAITVALWYSHRRSTLHRLEATRKRIASAR